jgi:hypothetical protein
MRVFTFSLPSAHLLREAIALLSPPCSFAAAPIADSATVPCADAQRLAATRGFRSGSRLAPHRLPGVIDGFQLFAELLDILNVVSAALDPGGIDRARQQGLLREAVGAAR